MDQHTPFIGRDYRTSARRILVVGYSHHTEGEDDVELTIKCGESAVRDEMPQPFFKRIPGYVNLGHDRATFWNSVAFINFVPRAIGGFVQKNAWASKDLHQEGYQRLRKLIGILKPTHIFVMTPKPDSACYTPYRIRDLGHHIRHTIATSHASYDWLDMEVEGHKLKVALLPHPQAASSDDMRQVFSALLAPGN